MQFPRPSFLPFSIYVSVSLLVTVYVLLIGNVGPQHYELAALPILLLAMPWGLIFHNFNPRIIASDYNNSVLIMWVFIPFNGAILFGLGLVANALARRSRGRQAE